MSEISDFCLPITFGNAYDAAPVLTGPQRFFAIRTIQKNHYTHSVPSGKSHYFSFEDALIAYSIPANKNIAEFLLGFPGEVWELSRLWAPDNHRPNLLTQAIRHSITSLRLAVPKLQAIVSYADPNAGHHGGVYRAASWIYHGQSEESRAYHSGDGQVKSRRAFHSGGRSMTRIQIEALGYTQTNLPGKHRFVKPVSHAAKKAVRQSSKDVSSGSPKLALMKASNK